MIRSQSYTSEYSYRSSHTIDKVKKSHYTQLMIVYEYLRENVATASMIADATGIPQKCICRYKRYLEKQGMLWEVEKRYCKLTGFHAWYLTTNPLKISNQSKQLSFFQE